MKKIPQHENRTVRKFGDVVQERIDSYQDYNAIPSDPAKWFEDEDGSVAQKLMEAWGLMPILLRGYIAMRNTLEQIENYSKDEIIVDAAKKALAIDLFEKPKQ